jgi:hypothetical protein
MNYLMNVNAYLPTLTACDRLVGYAAAFPGAHRRQRPRLMTLARQGVWEKLLEILPKTVHHFLLSSRLWCIALWLKVS